MNALSLMIPALYFLYLTSLGLWSWTLFGNITKSLTKRRSYVQGDTKPIVTPNERAMSADSKNMHFVPDTLLGLGAIVA